MKVELISCFYWSFLRVRKEDKTSGWNKYRSTHKHKCIEHFSATPTNVGTKITAYGTPHGTTIFVKSSLDPHQREREREDLDMR